MWNQSLLPKIPPSWLVYLFSRFFVGGADSQWRQAQTCAGRQQDAWDKNCAHRAGEEMLLQRNRQQPSCFPLFHQHTVGFRERLWKSVGCYCSVKNCWFFTSPGASPWRCSRPGCLCGDWPKMSWGDTPRVRSKGAIAEGLEMLTPKLRNVLLGWPTKTAACV